MHTQHCLIDHLAQLRVAALRGVHAVVDILSRIQHTVVGRDSHGDVAGKVLHQRLGHADRVHAVNELNLTGAVFLRKNGGVPVGRREQINDDLDAAVIVQDGVHHGIQIPDCRSRREGIQSGIEDVVDAQLENHHAHAGIGLRGHIVAEVEPVVIERVCICAVSRLCAVVGGFPAGPSLMSGRSRAPGPEQRQCSSGG